MPYTEMWFTLWKYYKTHPYSGKSTFRGPVFLIKPEFESRWLFSFLSVPVYTGMHPRLSVHRARDTLCKSTLNSNSAETCPALWWCTMNENTAKWVSER